MTDSSAVVEKSLRSVFVGNIPYEATDERLREIFGQVGPVISFKLMYDRESGKPKGYGFCEYKDQETALSAMRNLNGYEIGGRPLRVDNACTEKSRMEMQSLMMGPVVESPYGPDVDPEKAPEAISNAVASLPPEQMYELMRQMKLCVRNNASEARTMLMNNPQLAYALLQAQVVMRIIDPKVAVQILHGSRDPVEPILPTTEDSEDVSTPPLIPKGPPPALNGGPPMTGRFPPNQSERAPVGPSGPMVSAPGGFSQPPPHPQPVPPPNRPVFQGGDRDLRQMGGASRGPVSQAPSFPPPSSDQDMRMPPGNVGPHHGPPPDGFRGADHESGRFPRDFDQRENRYKDTREGYGRENRDRDSRPGRDPRGGGDKDYRATPSLETRDPRARNFSSSSQDKDFRSMPPTNTAPPPMRGAAPPSSGAPSSGSMDRQDQEKANLIMQVLQLSDEQIRMLPPEQQTSIIQLKEQIQRTSQ